MIFSTQPKLLLSTESPLEEAKVVNLNGNKTIANIK